MKILFIIDYYHPHLGGLETVFSNIIKNLPKNNYSIDIVTCHHDKQLDKVEQKENITIYRVGSTRHNFLRHALIYGHKLLKNNQYDIIHTTTYAGALPAKALSLIHKKPVLLTVHEVFGKLRYVYKPKMIAWFYLMYEKLLFWFEYSHYHCVSYYTYNSLRLMYGIKDKETTVIHNGVSKDRSEKTINKAETANIRNELSLQKNRLYILYYGHSGASKGLDYLVNALPEIYKKTKNVHIIINLIPAKRDNLIRSKIKSYNLPNVTLLNGLPESKLKHLVHTVDAVIAPSISEGFGSVHTETNALGTHLITTPIGPLPEVLSGSVTRIQPQSSDSIVKAITNIEKGKRGEFLSPKEFSWKKTTKKITEIYNKLLKKEPN